MSLYRKRPTLAEAFTFDEFKELVKDKQDIFEFNECKFIRDEKNHCFIYPNILGDERFKQGMMIVIDNQEDDLFLLDVDDFNQEYEPISEETAP